MDTLSEFTRRVMRAFYAKLRRNEMIVQYSNVLTHCEEDEPHLRPHALQK